MKQTCGMHKYAVALVLTVMLLGASPAPDQLPALRYLVGSWECTYRSGSTGTTYRAVYAYEAGGNWLVERDTSSGFSDEGRFTYDQRSRRWIVVITGSDRSATVFEGTGNARHITYRTVYPNAYASETVDRISPEKYMVHFTGTTNGQTATSTDVCVKQ